MSRRAGRWAVALLVLAVVVQAVDVFGVLPPRVHDQLRELAPGAPWVEVIFRAGLVVELWIELAVAAALMLAVRDAGDALARRFAADGAPVVRFGGSAAALLCAGLAGVAAALGGLSGTPFAPLVAVVPDPLFALALTGVWTAVVSLRPRELPEPAEGPVDVLIELPDEPVESVPVDVAPEPQTPAGVGAMHPAMVRTMLGKALDDGETARAVPLAQALLEVIERRPGTSSTELVHHLAVGAPLLLRCAAEPGFPPELAGRIAVRLGFVELRSVLHQGTGGPPGLPRPEGSVPPTEEERLDAVERLMVLGARLAPGDLDARLGLAWTRSAQHRDDEAQRLARAVRLKIDATAAGRPDVRGDLADLCRAVSAARLDSPEQADRLLARVARNHRSGSLPEALAGVVGYAMAAVQEAAPGHRFAHPVLTPGARRSMTGAMAGSMAGSMAEAMTGAIRLTGAIRVTGAIRTQKPAAAPEGQQRVSAEV